jgi:hypothetical protein
MIPIWNNMAMIQNQLNKVDGAESGVAQQFLEYLHIGRPNFYFPKRLGILIKFPRYGQNKPLQISAQFHSNSPIKKTLHTQKPPIPSPTKKNNFTQYLQNHFAQNFFIYLHLKSRNHFKYFSSVGSFYFVFYKTTFFFLGLKSHFFEVFDWGESFGDVKGPHD